LGVDNLQLGESHSTFHALIANCFSGKVEDELSEFVPSSSISTGWSSRRKGQFRLGRHKLDISRQFATVQIRALTQPPFMQAIAPALDLVSRGIFVIDMLPASTPISHFLFKSEDSQEDGSEIGPIYAMFQGHPALRSIRYVSLKEAKTVARLCGAGLIET